MKHVVNIECSLLQDERTTKNRAESCNDGHEAHGRRVEACERTASRRRLRGTRAGSGGLGLRGSASGRRRRAGGRGDGERVANGGERRALGRGRCRVRGWGVSVTLLEGGSAVDTHRISAVTSAVLEDTCAVVSGHVPVASHHVVDVVAKGGCAGSVLASAEAELAG